MTSILQFADIHFGVEDKDALAAIHDVVASLKPDVSVICGDITQNGSHQEFQAAQNWIQGLHGPKIVTAGNHDTPMFGLWQRLTGPFKRYDQYVGTLSEPVYINNHVLIIPYNSSRGWQLGMDWSLGQIDLDELDALVEAYADMDAPKIKLLACHHPLTYPSQSPLQKTTKNGVEARARLVEAGFSAVLSGHVHVPFVEQPSGMLSIGAGTLSKRRRGQAASFNHITAKGNTLQIDSWDWVDGSYRKVLSHNQMTAQSA